MPTVILRSRFARIGMVIIALITMYPVSIVWLADGYGDGLQALSTAVLLDVCLWLLWWRPQAELHDDALYVRNAWHRYRIAWEAVESARTRWELVLETTTRPITIAAAQRGGAFSTAWRQHRMPTTNEEYLTATGKTFRTHLVADDAAHLIELYKEARAERHKYESRQAKRAIRMEKHGHAVSAERLKSVPAGSENAVAVPVTIHFNWSSAVVVALAVAGVVLAFKLL